MKYWPHWGSFQPILIKIMQMTRGDVLELGMGNFSTPLLHNLCLDMGRNLVSYENDKKYYDMHVHFHKPHHKLHFVEDWDKIDLNQEWSVAFVDHSPAKRRRVEIRRLVNNAEYVLVHDTQPEDDKFYRQSAMFELYKYRYDYTKIKPHTTVLSNFHDLTTLDMK